MISGRFVPAARSTSCDRSRVRQRRWIVTSSSGAGSCADSPDALPSPSPDRRDMAGERFPEL
jgi:hypothetical protein